MSFLQPVFFREDRTIIQQLLFFFSQKKLFTKDFHVEKTLQGWALVYVVMNISSLPSTRNT